MQCALCQQSKILCDSHIIPEFLYNKLYDQKHSYFFATTDPSERAKLRRRGIYEKLLCKSCESFISRFETYAKKIFAGNVKIDNSNSSRWIVLQDLDYEKFKLFQISLLWRASVSQRREFSKCNLGPHDDRMHKMLLEGKPGEPYEYGCILFYFPIAQKEMQMIISPPELIKRKINGHRCYLAVFGGLMWVYFVSKHTYTFRLREVFLSKTGQQPIFNIGTKGMEWAMELWADLKAADKFNQM